MPLAKNQRKHIKGDADANWQWWLGKSLYFSVPE
jgi:hypothetical protein